MQEQASSRVGSPLHSYVAVHLRAFVLVVENPYSKKYDPNDFFCAERRKAELWRAVQKQEWGSVRHQLSQTHLKAFKLSTIQSRCWSGMAASQRVKEITAELRARILGSSILSSLSFLGSDII